MMLVAPKMGTTPPGMMEGAIAAAALSAFGRAALRNRCAASCRANANRTSFRKGGALELPRFCFETRTLAVGSGVSRTVLAMVAAEAPVTIAIAELPTAA